MPVLLVQMLDGTVLDVHCDFNPADINSTMTVGDLKSAVHEQRPDLPMLKMTLVFAGKQLPEDDFLLNTSEPDVRAIGLQPESTLHLVMRQ